MNKKGKKSKNTPKKEEIAEDWCFVCKDGGLLMVCEYKHCLKAYHTDCVDKDDSFLEAGNHWTCDLHSCFICHKSTNVHCLCCPTAVCRRCIKDAEFVQVRGKKGFCRHCLKLALLVEEKLDVDSDGDNVDFKDRETYEGLFREYWEIINEKEGLTLENLQSADVRMRKGKYYKSSSDSDDHEECKENEVIFDLDNADDIEARKPNHRRKQSKGKKSAMKRKVISNRKEFIGWGSSALIKFLESIGINVDDDLSQRDVTAIINDYIKEKKLFHPEKKRLVVCDGSLQSVLGRKTVNKHKIYDYLDPHFAENQQSSEEDEIGYDSENKNDISVVCRKLKKSGKNTAFLEKDMRLNLPQLHYASIVPENINLVYLRRSLVQKLLEEPETFESKVIGSFVKVKSDPNDYFRKNSHQLMQVTDVGSGENQQGNRSFRSSSHGTTRNSGGGNEMKILLQVSGTPKDISISLLSDYDISEEECEELKVRVKSGLLKQSTIIELKQKARSLHEDITKHWIARELVLLQNRIDQANEKGWRRELFEYLQRRQILETSEEQSRLLQKVPDVIADVEVELLSEDIKDDKKGDESSLISIPNGSSDTPCHKWEGSGITSVAKEKKHHILVPDEQANAILKSDSHLYRSCKLTDVEQGAAKNQQTMAFELSSDEDGNNKSGAATGNQGFEDPKSPVWLCIGPDGEKKGPYSLAFIKHWKEVSSYSSKFKVLKIGQSEKNAIPLNDAVTLLI